MKIFNFAGLFRPALRVATLAICTLGSVQGLGTAHAAESEDFTALSLEELAEITVSSSIALGIHHTHPKGEWMLGYSFMPMSMSDNRDGTDELSVDDVFDQGFLISPTSMDMNMHMFEAMYGATDNLTLMAMLPWKNLSMDHVTAGGATFTTKSEGIGDAALTGLYTFLRSYPHRLHLTAGVSIPTGSIEERGTTPMGTGLKLPYPMQLGSGTFDPSLGITYLGASGDWSWGAHTEAKFRIGDNDEDYTLGNQYVLDTWLARRWNNSLSSFVRLETAVIDNIDGADPELNPAMVPTANPDLRAGKRLNLRVGTSIYVPDGALLGSRMGIEFGLPIYQSLDGPQLQSDWVLSIVFQWVH